MEQVFCRKKGSDLVLSLLNLWSPWGFRTEDKAQFILHPDVLWLVIPFVRGILNNSIHYLTDLSTINIYCMIYSLCLLCTFPTINILSTIKVT